jgi:hypothetical protein
MVAVAVAESGVPLLAVRVLLQQLRDQPPQPTAQTVLCTHHTTLSTHTPKVSSEVRLSATRQATATQHKTYLAAGLDPSGQPGLHLLRTTHRLGNCQPVLKRQHAGQRIRPEQSGVQSCEHSATMKLTSTWLMVTRLTHSSGVGAIFADAVLPMPSPSPLTPRLMLCKLVPVWWPLVPLSPFVTALVMAACSADCFAAAMLTTSRAPNCAPAAARPCRALREGAATALCEAPGSS